MNSVINSPYFFDSTFKFLTKEELIAVSFVSKNWKVGAQNHHQWKVFAEGVDKRPGESWFAAVKKKNVKKWGGDLGKAFAVNAAYLTSLGGVAALHMIEDQIQWKAPNIGAYGSVALVKSSDLIFSQQTTFLRLGTPAAVGFLEGWIAIPHDVKGGLLAVCGAQISDIAVRALGKKSLSEENLVCTAAFLGALPPLLFDPESPLSFVGGAVGGTWAAVNFLKFKSHWDPRTFLAFNLAYSIATPSVSDPKNWWVGASILLLQTSMITYSLIPRNKLIKFTKMAKKLFADEAANFGKTFTETNVSLINRCKNLFGKLIFAHLLYKS